MVPARLCPLWHKEGKGRPVRLLKICDILSDLHHTGNSLMTKLTADSHLVTGVRTVGKTTTSVPQILE